MTGAQSLHHAPLGRLRPAGACVLLIAVAAAAQARNPCGPLAGALTCGATVTGTTSGAVNAMASYSCSNWDESGPEHVFSLVLPPGESRPVSAELSNLGADLDLFVLGPDSCDSSACVAYGDNGATWNGAGGATYYLAIDGYNGAAGAYAVTVNCPGWLKGEVDDLYLGGAPTCAPATVHVEPGALDLAVDLDSGSYGPVSLAAGTYTLTASATNYQSAVATDIVVDTALTTTMNFSLVRPVASSDPPDLLSLLGSPGVPVVAPLVIENSGDAIMQWEVYEAGGDVPWLSGSPVTGTVTANSSFTVEETCECPDQDDHLATLWVVHDDPCTGMLAVDVVLHCRVAIFADGFESGSADAWSLAAGAMLFADGFETGDTSAWSLVPP